MIATLLFIGFIALMLIGVPIGAALGLAGADGTDHAAVEQISLKYPTSAIAVLRVPCRWSRLELAGAALVDFHVPR